LNEHFVFAIEAEDLAGMEMESAAAGEDFGAQDY
jgi:hypothetical protein